MYPKPIIFLAFIFAAGTLRPQSSWRIDQLGAADGLPQVYVYAIHQDKKGFIWIGTHGGLNRYDGYGFKVFQYRPFDSSSLGDNSVFFLKEDSLTGKFWIGGSSCLNEFDPETFTNTRYRYADIQLEFSDGIFINKYQILLACEYDVLLFDTRKKTFSKVPVYDENNRLTTISRVENTASDKKGNFMVMSKTGIFFFDPATQSCRRKTASSPDFSPFYQFQVFNVHQDHNGYYWIATNKKGLIRFDPVSREIKTIALPAPLENESLRFDIVMEDSRQNIWAGSSGGLFKIDPITLATEFFSSDRSKAVSLSNAEINAITEDRNHIMWIGTVGGGINKMIPQNTGFRNLLISGKDANANTGTYIMSLQQTGKTIWFTNIWDQVGKADLPTGKITLLGKSILPPGYSWYSEGSIVKMKDNTPVILNGENAYHIEEKTNGDISVRAQSAPGLYHIHHSVNGSTYYMVRTKTDSTFYRNDTVYGNQFFYDAKDDNAGNIWIGSSQGLIKLDTKNNAVTQYRHKDDDINSVSSNFIYGLELDNSYQQIWMAAYNGGLCSYNIQSDKFKYYDKEDGLADNIVYAIEKDNHGNFWFTTNTGIYTYNVTDKSFRNYGMADGLLNSEFNRQSSYRNAEGWIFFGGICGIDYFHPDSIQKNSNFSNLTFTSFRIFNKDHTLKKPVIQLNHDDHYISFEFSTLEYNDQQKIQYAYRLDNSKEWINLGYQHILSFSDFGIGNHHLYIRSTNLEGIWLNNEIACSIIMHPTWWQTWWFRLLVIVAVAAIAALFIRNYLQRNLQKQRAALEKEQAIEKERTRIATDMHDDLGAGLSRIKFLSEAISMKKEDDPAIKHEIGKISSYSHEMIEKMGEIVWALNEKNDTIADLLAFTRSYAVDYLQNHGIECEVEAPPELPQFYINGETRRNVFLSVKECLFNIVKHAGATAVTMRFSIDRELQIWISDNGKGIDWKGLRPYGNGIANIKKRMEALQGSAEFTGKNGTTVWLKIPFH